MEVSCLHYHTSLTKIHQSNLNSITLYSSAAGVRFWDIRTSERTADITDLHYNGVTSVRFNPTNNAEVLTTGRDSVVRLIDVRKAGEELQSFSHTNFKIDLSYAACAISPDGKFKTKERNFFVFVSVLFVHHSSSSTFYNNPTVEKQ